MKGQKDARLSVALLVRMFLGQEYLSADHELTQLSKTNFTDSLL